MRRSIPITVFVMVLFLVLPCYGQVKPSGLETYYPTKIEWAALELQANYRIHDWRPESLTLSVSWIDTDIDTITCFIVYNADAPAKGLEIQKAHVQELFEMFKKRHEWDWMKLEVKTKLEKSKP